MTQRRRTTILAAAALPAVVLATAAFTGRDSSASPPAREHTRHLEIEATIASFAFADANASGVTAGDSFVQTDTHASGGTDVFRCTATGAETDPGFCDGVLVLDGGTITVAGRLPRFEPQDGLPFVWTVTGGTAAYVGAAGEVDVVETATGYTANVTLLP